MKTHKMKTRFFTFAIALALLVGFQMQAFAAISALRAVTSVPQAVSYTTGSSTNPVTYTTYASQGSATNTTSTSSGCTFYKNNITVYVPSNATYLSFRYTMTGTPDMAPYYYIDGVNVSASAGLSGSTYYTTAINADLLGNGSEFVVRYYNAGLKACYEVHYTVNFV